MLLAAFVIGTAAMSESSMSLGSLSESSLAREQSLESEWSSVLDPETKKEKYKSPVQRVISLLKKMKAELETEQEKDAELYDKMVCWCETNEKEKSGAIDTATTSISELEAEIEQRSALSAKLLVLIEKMKEEIEKNVKSKEKSLAIREKEAADFNDRQRELIMTITNLKNAIVVLEKHSGALLQDKGSLVTSLRAVFHDIAQQYDLLQGDAKSAGGENLLSQRLEVAFLAVGARTERASASQEEMASQGVFRSLLAALDRRQQENVQDLPVKFAQEVLSREAAHVEAREPSLVQQPSANAGSYSAQSGVILGILKQMKDDFEKELAEATGAEQKAAVDYSSFSSELLKMIDTGKKQLDEYQAQYYSNKKMLVDATELLAMVRSQRGQDVDFLRNLRLVCQDLDHQWILRSKSRRGEIQAVAEALAILAEDDNRELTAKTVALLQVDEDSAAGARLRANAAAKLRRAAQSPDLAMDDLLAAWHGRSASASQQPALSGRPQEQLSTLAVSVELDSFTKVKAAMDKLVAELKAEQQEEVELKLFCQKEFDANEKTTYKKSEEKRDIKATIESLATLIAKLKEEIGAAKERVSEAHKEIKFASEDREAENAEYQQVVSDQRATQTILKKALDKLAAVYKAQARGVAALQGEQTPPGQFAPYKQHGGASPVMGLIEQIIEDSKKLEAQAVKGEEEAQAGYEKFVKDANAEIDSLTNAIVRKSKSIETAKLDSETAHGDLEATNAELESLSLYLGDLHQQCDFVVKNFDIRQKARLNEIEAIQEAKSILSGMAL